MRNKKTNEVTEGVMLFADALINDHHADSFAVYQSLAKEIKSKLQLLIAIDPSRNR